MNRNYIIAAIAGSLALASQAAYAGGDQDVNQIRPNFGQGYQKPQNGTVDSKGRFVPYFVNEGNGHFSDPFPEQQLDSANLSNPYQPATPVRTDGKGHASQSTWFLDKGEEVVFRSQKSSLWDRLCDWFK